MQPTILTASLNYTIHGFSLQHDRSKSYGEEILALLGRVWPLIKSGKIPHDGINRVVYSDDGTVFAGLVLGDGWESIPDAAKLERKTVQLTRYAVWKHVGPYHQIARTGAAMTQALTAMGLRTGWPMVEVYGHWTSDESKLETETFVAVQ